ncbi:MAG: hypothetical protein IPO73_03850 [Gemmatimonadetes bacterium]|nr:hypothetical protein [Gemmatimonadota bacterium]
MAPPEGSRAGPAGEAGDGAPEGEADHRLLDLVQQRFADYYEAKRWLDAAGIPYAKDFDGGLARSLPVHGGCLLPGPGGGPAMSGAFFNL